MSVSDDMLRKIVASVTSEALCAGPQLTCDMARELLALREERMKSYTPLMNAVREHGHRMTNEEIIYMLYPPPALPAPPEETK